MNAIVADRSGRSPTSFEGRPEINDHLRDVAHEVARLGSATYDRTARFFGNGARTIHLGVTSAADNVIGAAKAVPADAGQAIMRGAARVADRYNRAEDRAALAVGATERVIVRGAAAMTDHYDRVVDRLVPMVASTERVIVRGAAAVVGGYNATLEGARAVPRAYNRAEDRTALMVGATERAIVRGAAVLTSGYNDAVAQVRAVPRAFTALLGHMTEMRRAASEGIKTGILETGRFFARQGGQAIDATRRTRDGLRDAATAHVTAVGSFVRSARESRPAPVEASMSVKVGEEASRLRRWATGITLGVAMTGRLVAHGTLEKAARARRFLSDGSLAIQVGATEGLRRVAQNRQMQMAGFVAAASGLVAVGLGAHATDLGSMLTDLHAQMPDVSTMASSAARGAGHMFDADSGVQVASADEIGRLANRALRAGSEYWSHVATAFGQAPAGQELVRVAGGSHVSGAAEAYAQAVHTGGQGHGAHHVVAHAAGHHGHHGHAGHHAASRPGDQVADSLNDAELLKIKLDGLKAGHGTATVAHHVTNVSHGGNVSDVTGTAPVVPVYAETLPPVDHRAIHQVASRAAPGLRDFLPSMPHIEMSTITRELGLSEAFASPSVSR